MTAAAWVHMMITFFSITLRFLALLKAP